MRGQRSSPVTPTELNPYDALSRSRKQRIAIEMRLAMVGEGVERSLDSRLVADFSRRSERREPRRALAIVGEQPMHIGAGDLAAWGHCAVGLAVREAKERPGTVWARCFADMHLIAPKRRAIREAGAFDLA